MENRGRGTSFEGVQGTNEETNEKIKLVIVRYRWEKFLGVLTSEASKGYEKKKSETERSKLWINIHY